jgi:hypothetical protein
MIRTVLGVVAGFLVWMIAWFGGETILSAIWPAFGVHQAAFQAAIENGPDPSGFTADSTMLLTHIVLGSVASLISGFLAALIAGENRRIPLAVGCLLLGMAIMKAVTSWPLVPVWYHVIFTAILLPMAIIGGRLKSTT